MAEINIKAEMLANHSDEEIIDYLDGLMTGILKNYKLAYSSGKAEPLWGSLGDVVLVQGVIREIRKRNAARQSMRENE